MVYTSQVDNTTFEIIIRRDNNLRYSVTNIPSDIPTTTGNGKFTVVTSGTTPAIHDLSAYVTQLVLTPAVPSIIINVPSSYWTNIADFTGEYTVYLEETGGSKIDRFLLMAGSISLVSNVIKAV